MASSNAQRVPRETRQSIRTRLLILLVGLTTAAVLAVGYLGVSSVQRIGRSARLTSAGALRVQAEEFLRQGGAAGAGSVHSPGCRNPEALVISLLKAPSS